MQMITRRKKNPKWLIIALTGALLGGGAGVYMAQTFPQAVKDAVPKVPQYRMAAEFRMLDLDRGWIRYADGLEMTADGGITWQRTDAVPSGGSTELDSAAPPLWDPPAKILTVLTYQTKEFPVKQSQFYTEQIGWAIVEQEGELGGKLFYTSDGGKTWETEPTAGIREAIRQEKQLREQWKREAPLYASLEQVKQVARTEWRLLPDTASPGDVILVRHAKPGNVEWQGKTYPLQPFGAGYFTYLPIGAGVKPGEYRIGDQSLKIAAKSFPTQHLQVSEQLESMRQDTKRIQADQVKIDAARSQSEPEFLFNRPFVIPVEGRLTTPFGHTRYVNGKLSGSHLALDLAAKQGTPVQATNDGVVALADNLYLTGNSIYIDHGMGLFSQYAHLSELRVKTGDRVERGDIIGLVGSTGFSTGPHLHFTFWAHNVPVNPNLFFDTVPFHWGAKAQP